MATHDGRQSSVAVRPYFAAILPSNGVTDVHRRACGLTLNSNLSQQDLGEGFRLEARDVVSAIKGERRPCGVGVQTPVEIEERASLPSMRADKHLSRNVAPASAEIDGLEKRAHRMRAAARVEMMRRRASQPIGRSTGDEGVAKLLAGETSARILSGAASAAPLTTIPP